MYNNRLYKPGYAIAEVLLAMVIISVSFLQLSQSLGNIMDAAKENIFVTRAINIANSTMEEVMAQSFDEKGSEAGGYVLDFDGTNDYVDTGNSFQSTFRNSFTISCWIMADDGQPPSIQSVLGAQNSGEEDCVRLEILVDGKIKFHYEANTADATVTTSSAIFSDGATDWTHIVCVADDSQNECLIYVNGESQTVTGTGTNTSGVTFNDWTSADELFIGARDDDGSASRYFDGKIDEVRIWNDVRTAAEILANYNRSITNPYDDGSLKLYLRMNNGSGSIAFDHSSSMAHGTLENGPTWTSQSSSWSTTLGTEGEASWSDYDDVDDFNGVSEVPDDIYTGITKTVTVVYVDINATTWAVTSPSGSPPTDYKEITVRVDIPGGDSYAQLKAIKSAKTIQNYTLTYSPYGD